MPVYFFFCLLFYSFPFCLDHSISEWAQLFDGRVLIEYDDDGHDDQAQEFRKNNKIQAKLLIVGHESSRDYIRTTIARELMMLLSKKKGKKNKSLIQRLLALANKLDHHQKFPFCGLDLERQGMFC